MINPVVLEWLSWLDHLIRYTLGQIPDPPDPLATRDLYERLHHG